MTGEIVSGAIANFTVGQGWFVSVDLRGGSPGADDFNNLAGVCFVRDATVCPSGRIAIEIDGFVESAPSVQSPDLGRTVQITGNFSESEAKDLALVLRFGSLPLSFEAEDVNPISSTLGEDALDEAVPEALKCPLDAPDIDQVVADAEDHGSVVERRSPDYAG